METVRARWELTFLLQLAYSGERAAAQAYWGHRHSLSSPTERLEVGKICREELVHRRCLLGMLARLDAGPDPLRDRKMNRVGKTISFLCQIGGWFLPMYGAAKLESQNIREYELAARLAHVAGFEEMVEPLLEMAEVEWDHELYFRSKAMERKLFWKLMPKWPLPAPREEIRRSFSEFIQDTAWVVPEVLAPAIIR